MALACLLLTLEHGLLPLGTLGRPMGWPVLEAEFLVPAAEVWRLVTCQGPACTSTSQGVQAVFRVLLLLICLVALLVHILLTLGNLAFNPTFRGAELNEELFQEIEEKEREIQAWMSLQESAAVSDIHLSRAGRSGQDCSCKEGRAFEDKSVQTSAADMPEGPCPQSDDESVVVEF